MLSGLPANTTAGRNQSEAPTAPSGLPLAKLPVVLEVYLGFLVYRDRFREVLRT